MRLLAAAAFVLATCFAPATLHAETFEWPGYGKVDVTVPSGWSVRAHPMSVRAVEGFALIAEPTPVVNAQLALLSSKQPLKMEDLKDLLEDMTRKIISGSVEKAFDPKPLTLSQGFGFMVELTDASQVGKPLQPGEYKRVRSAIAFVDDRMMLVATILFNDPSQPEVEATMSLISSLRFERTATTRRAPTTSDEPFTFTVPGSRVLVKVPDTSLHIDNTASDRFKLSRRDPMLILSGWLEPASRYKGLRKFWQTESRSPAYAGALAPTRVEMLRAGPWEVVAFDIPLRAGGTMANLRAERVMAGTWIDLHLSTAAQAPSAKLRAELLDALRQVEVIEK